MKICPVCGKEFNPTGNHQKYCSEHCSRKKYNNNASTRKHNATLGPKERHRAYLAYDCRCAVCGWRASDVLMASDTGLAYGLGNELHHIDLCSQDGGTEDGNLILLCPNHHKLAHMGQISKNTLRALAKPLTLTDAERNEKENKASALVNEIWNEEKPSDEALHHYLMGLTIVGCLKRAGYWKLNTIWNGWVDEMEQAALDRHKEQTS